MDIPSALFPSSFTIKVKPNSSKSKITSVKQNILYVDIKAPAQNDKANMEVIKFFSKLLKKKVKIMKGLTSKVKILKILE